MPYYPPTSSAGLTVTVDKATKTDGNVTCNSTSWANVDTAIDLTVAASEGDNLLVTLNAFVDNEAVALFLDGATIVSGSPVNYLSGSGASDTGVQSWRGASGTAGGMGGSIMYTVVAGDIDGGNVTIRLRYRTSAASNKTLRANTTDRLHFSVANLG